MCFCNNNPPIADPCTEDCEMGQNSPNPFEGSTTIPICVNQTGTYTLKFYQNACANPNGPLLYTEVININEIGPHNYIFEQSNLNGTVGVVCYELTSSNCSTDIQKNMLVLSSLHDDDNVENRYRNNRNSDILSVYPNPTTGHTTIEMNHDEPMVSISILNAEGQVCLEKIVNMKNKSNIELNNLSNGIYLVYVKTINTTYIKKLIKQ